jgi:hypothetical protein
MKKGRSAWGLLAMGGMIGYCTTPSDTVSLIQEIREKMHNYPNPFTGQEPLTPLAGQGVWFPQAIKKLRLLSLRAKRMSRLPRAKRGGAKREENNLLADLAFPITLTGWKARPAVCRLPFAVYLPFIVHRAVAVRHPHSFIRSPIR